MRKIIGIICLLLSVSSIYGQKFKTVKGPVFEKYGKTYEIEQPDLLLDSDTNYQVLFDVFTDPSEGKSLNPLINTVARFINMHVKSGISQEKMSMVLVLHGSAVTSALSERSYKKKFKEKSPNELLVRKMMENGVKVIVCGQSLKHKGFTRSDLNEGVQLSLSAMTALVHYQKQGYSLINFN